MINLSLFNIMHNAISGAIGDTSTEKIYQKLGSESLKSRRWFRKVCRFYNIFN